MDEEQEGNDSELWSKKFFPEKSGPSRMTVVLTHPSVPPLTVLSIGRSTTLSLLTTERTSLMIVSRTGSSSVLSGANSSASCWDALSVAADGVPSGFAHCGPPFEPIIAILAWVLYLVNCYRERFTCRTADLISFPFSVFLLQSCITSMGAQLLLL